MATLTNENEVVGATVALCLAEVEDDTWQYTVLSTVTDLDFNLDEGDDDWEPAHRRRTKRYRLNNTADLDVDGVVDDELEMLSEVGYLDENGAMQFGRDERRHEGDDGEYLTLHYFDHEPDFESVNMIDDAELVNLFGDVEATGLDIDPMATPPETNITFWIEEEVILNWDGTDPAE